jgi:hypothetical protein
MITFQNSRIRVTVTNDIAAQFSKNIMRGKQESPEQALRGRILSCAMEKLGNKSELALMYKEGISTDDVFSTAFMSLMCQYLEQHGKYCVDEVINRYLLGSRMSEGMAHEKDLAVAYAQGILAPLSDEQSRKELEHYVLSMAPDAPLNIREVDTFKQKMLLRRNAGNEDASHALEEAAAAVLARKQVEMQYREARAKMNGWKIEVIGDLPEQIGVCRVTQ